MTYGSTPPCECLDKLRQTQFCSGHTLRVGYYGLQRGGRTRTPHRHARGALYGTPHARTAPRSMTAVRRPFGLQGGFQGQALAWGGVGRCGLPGPVGASRREAACCKGGGPGRVWKVCTAAAENAVGVRSDWHCVLGGSTSRLDLAWVLHSCLAKHDLGTRFVCMVQAAPVFGSCLTNGCSLLGSGCWHSTVSLPWRCLTLLLIVRHSVQAY